MPPEITLNKSQQFVPSSDGLQLHVATYGDSNLSPLVLVHGYPDNHLVWQPVAELLADRYFVICYDVRGAGQSQSGKRIKDYALAQLARDLKAVVDTIIPDRRFHLAAHDWGSIQSWESVTTEALQGRIISYSSISGPCLDHVGHWMRRRLINATPAARRQAFKQLMSSWYIMMFQLPLLAPTLWQVAGRYWPNYLKLREGITEPHPNPTQTADGKEGVNLYRANFTGKLLKPEIRYAHCPVQLIVPKKDFYVSTALFDDLHEWVSELYRRDLDANHWAPLSHSALVAEWINEFAQSTEHNQVSDSLSAARIA